MMYCLLSIHVFIVHCYSGCAAVARIGAAVGSAVTERREAVAPGKIH